MKRYRNDSVKPGRGIDGAEGERFTKQHNRPGYPPPRDAETSPEGHGAYTDDDSGLRNVTDFQFSASSRDIFDDVNANSRPGGDDNFDSAGAIKAGVNRSQSE